MLACQKHHFSLPAHIHYLNGAYMSPLMNSVEAIGQKAVSKKLFPSDIPPTEFFDSSKNLRQTLAQLVNADENRLAIIPSVSYGMATVAKNLAQKPGLMPGQHILTVAHEFPSDIYAWEEVCTQKGLSIKTIPVPEVTIDKGKTWNENLYNAINENTVALVVCHVHWADGTLFDLEKLSAKCKQYGTWLIIDVTQSLGALPLDIEKIQPDAMVCAGYKWLMGPYSLGFAYYSETFDHGQPIEQSWVNRLNSDDFNNLIQYQSQYRPAAYRYNMGEQSNFILNPMLQAAVEQLLAWGVANIQEYCRQLVAEPIKNLQQAGYIVDNEPYRANHLFGIILPKNKKIEVVLAQLKEANVQVSVRGSSIRVSPNVYNTENDMQALVKALTIQG